ncbi:hypothetical protein M406DRAFT_231532, partial [Cryphonectria parasitica EP155]
SPAQSRHSSSSSFPSPSTTHKNKPTPSPPRPSASVLLLSPTNEILLLHRVQTSSSFPSAHVFPGGNLSPFHEPSLSTTPDAPLYHVDGPAYRLAAIRETFEESGLLLARRPGSNALVSLGGDGDDHDTARARKAVHADELHFARWVESELGAVPCLDDLVPFTRWITPPNVAKRFTTQMYLFLMPSTTGDVNLDDVVMATTTAATTTPTSDGGIEHTAATFAPAAEWLARQERGEIVLFPPQLFLLTMVARVFESVSEEDRDPEATYEAQRKALLEFVTRVPSCSPEEEVVAQRRKVHPTALIPWTDKVMSPTVLFVRTGDKRIVLGLDKPGLELKGSGRGGDFERVVLVNFGKEGPRNVEVRDREEVLKEEREAK